MALPTSLMTAAMAIIPSSMSGAVLLAVRYGRSSCGILDVALIVAGMLLSVAPLLFVVKLWATKAHGDAPSWVCVSLSEENIASNHRGTLLATIKFALHRTLRRSWKWRRAMQPSRGTPQGAQVLLLEYRVLWYPSLDATVLTALSMFTVIGGLNHENPILCRGSTIASLLLLMVQCALIAKIQPFTSLFSLVVALATVILTCLSVAAQLIVVVSTSSSTLWLDNASTICNLVILSSSCVRMCLDAHDVAFAVKKRILTCGNDPSLKIDKTIEIVDDGTIILQEDHHMGHHHPRDNINDYLSNVFGINVDNDDNIDLFAETSFETQPHDHWHSQQIATASESSSKRGGTLSAVDAAVEKAVSSLFWDESGNALGSTHVVLTSHHEEPSFLASITL